MAPEQIRGRGIDPRTDIYAAGKVLYEMATGARPFADAHGPMLTEAILHQAPTSPRERQPAVSPGLEFVILKALEKEPEQRYQSARELLLDLERLATPSVATAVPERARRRRWPVVVAAAAVLALAVGGLAAWRLLRTAREAPIASLAVLPLQNFSGDPGQEFFVDGMTDALIAGLAQIKAVKVISWTSVIEYFRQAIALDPENALAYVGLAEAYGIRGQMAGLPMAEVGPLQREAARRALEIDDSLSEAHAALATVKQDVDWDWLGAEREFRRAIELSPSSASSHLWYSQLLNWLGRHEESLASITRARELDPLNPFIATNAVFRLYFLGRYDEAIAQSGKLLEVHGDYWLDHWVRGLLYSAKGMHQDAIAEQEKAVALSEGSLECLPWLGYACAKAGRTTEALGVLDRLERESAKRYVPPILFAPVYAGLGEKDRAFEFLERGYAERDMRLVWLIMDPTFEPLRSDPRMRDLRRRMGLPGWS